MALDGSSIYVVKIKPYKSNPICKNAFLNVKVFFENETWIFQGPSCNTSHRIHIGECTERQPDKIMESTLSILRYINSRVMRITQLIHLSKTLLCFLSSEPRLIEFRLTYPFAKEINSKKWGPPKGKLKGKTIREMGPISNCEALVQVNPIQKLTNLMICGDKFCRPNSKDGTTLDVSTKGEL